MSSQSAQRILAKGKAVKAKWDGLTEKQRVAVYRKVSGKTVGGVEMIAAKAVAQWFADNWARAMDGASSGVSDPMLAAANWLDAVGSAIAEQAKKVRDFLHSETLFFAGVAVAVLLAYGWAKSR